MSTEIDRVLRKLDDMDERSRSFEVCTTRTLAELQAGVVEASRTRESVVALEGRVDELERERDERKGARKGHGRNPLVIAGAAGAGAGGLGLGGWLMQWIRDLFA